MDFKYLKLLDVFKSLFVKMGINYEVMRKILQIKLIMDTRRVPTVFSDKKKAESDDKKNMFFKSLLIYMFFGLFMVPFVIMKYNYIFQMSFVFGMVMFLVITSLISDFSSVLLDIKDKNIIGVRPVNQKTLNMAKSMHILYYMLCLSGALAGPSLAASLIFQEPLFFLLYLLLLILIDIFCIILTTLIYFLILRFFDGEKLKDIINYVQIILSIVIMIGYQLIGRMFNYVDMLKISFVPHWWQYMIFPIWFAAPFQILQKSQMNHYLVIFSVMAIAIPIILFIFYIKLMPVFEKSLQKLGNNYSKEKNISKSEGIFAKILCHNRCERIFYRFSMDMMKNERAFKLKVYPTIGFSLVCPFIFMIQILRDSGLKELTQGNTYLFIYFCGMMLPTLIVMMRYSESYKAAWIYKAMPIEDMKPVFQGTIKAFLIRIFLPVYIIEAAIFGVMYGTRIIPDLFVVFLNMFMFSIICFIFLDKSLPFSKNFEAAQQTNATTGLLLLLLLALQAGVHYFFTTFQYGVFIYLCIDLIIIIIMWEAAFKVSTEKLT